MAGTADAQAKNMPPPPDKGLVYVVRPSVVMGFASNGIKMPVYCDDRLIGTTGGGCYVYAIPEPGPHVFWTECENRSELPLVIEAGERYDLEQQYRMGLFSPRVELVRLPNDEGRRKLMKCSLSKENTLKPE